MVQISRILCPVDCSEFSRRALEHAVALARWYGAQVTVFHVYTAPQPLVAVTGTPGDIPLLPPVQPEEVIEEVRRFCEPVMAAPLPRRFWSKKVIPREGSRPRPSESLPTCSSWVPTDAAASNACFSAQSPRRCSVRRDARCSQCRHRRKALLPVRSSTRPSYVRSISRIHRCGPSSTRCRWQRNPTRE